MRVLKFGGTSVGTHEGRVNICNLATQNDEKCIVVVSALSGVTDSLVALAREAAAKNINNVNELIAKLRSRHSEAIELSTPIYIKEQIAERCKTLLDELELLARTIINKGELTTTDDAAMVAYGEKLSSIILCSMMEGAEHVDSTTLIKTSPYFNRHIVNFPVSNSLIKEKFENIAAQVIVMGGFISSDAQNGEVTNLGRGGSDYTAAIVASALHVSTLYIYTDVDGFLSSDPRIINNAILVEELDFVEAMELCNFGAKIVYPPTIFPAYNANIPIVVRSTYNHTCAGTTITNKKLLSKKSPLFKGISSINDTALLTIQGLGSIGLIGVNYRIFKALGKSGIPIFLVSQRSSENCTSIAMKNGDATRAAEILHQEFSEEIARGEIEECKVMKNVATIAVIGSSLSGNTEITATIFNTLRKNGINIITSGQGGAQNSIAFITELASLRRATQVLHDALFIRHYSELNLFIEGENALSDNLRALIKSSERKIMERHGLQINVIEGEDILSSKAPELVFVDCTSQKGKGYNRLLKRGINVVSANKERVCKSKHYPTAKFLYGATLGEGTPVARVLNDLRASGDTIKSIAGAFSGVINYILELFHSGIKFSEAAAKASEEYYGEADIWGRDVEMQIEIMANISGLEVEKIECESLRMTDEKWEELRSGLKEGEKLAYISEVNESGAKSTLKTVNQKDALYHTGGFNTIVMINSARYRECPLQIKGYDSRTIDMISAEMLSDILSIADIH